MSRHAPIKLSPTAVDLAIARTSRRAASRREMRLLHRSTILADEKVVAAGTALFWLYARFGRRDRALVREADHALAGVAIAVVTPHLLKHLFARERPDRTVGRGRPRGISHAGTAWDSFPSGHAINLGVMAGPIGRIVSRRWRFLVWPGLAALAASRVLLLAHYASDVIAGLGLGVLIDKSLNRVMPPKKD